MPYIAKCCCPITYSDTDVQQKPYTGYDPKSAVDATFTVMR